MAALCTRYFVANPAKVVEGQRKIFEFLNACFMCTWVRDVYIAVNIDRDHGDTLGFLAGLVVPEGKRLVAFPVTPWGRYVEPLNALMERATHDRHQKALFVNTEHLPTDTNIVELDRYLQSDTLAVGGYLEGFHNFAPGSQRMNGMNVPADAFMLVDLEKLGLLGFIYVSEALWIPCTETTQVGTADDPGMAEAGIKEVPTFSLIQDIFARSGRSARVKLVRMTGGQRNAEGIDSKRKQMDAYKRSTALVRANIQMERLGIPYGIVEHLE